ncbi:MAG: hypothetical protein M1834_000385 [Cirrosporium novae-zelandiae]|nr:MAG: hypothetical protein M1834_000385 [Cirrosporium novae-zelandiae]
MAPSTAPSIPLPASSSFPQGTSLPPALRTQLNTALLTTHTIDTLQITLLTSLQQTGWAERVRARALQLLRSGECTNYGEVMSRVCEEVRGELDGTGSQMKQRRQSMNGNGGENNNSSGKVDIKIPEKVVKDGIRVVKEALEEVVDIE